MKVSKLSLSSAKFKVKLVRKSQTQVELTIVKINGIRIKCVDNLNLLGLIIHKNLTWKNQINKVLNCIIRIIGIINTLKFTCPQTIFLNI